MITIQNLTKKFGKFTALNNISLSLEKGECIALIGPNGCGKTTLIKAILGMIVPNEGDIFFQNKSIKNEYAYRENIGYMPQIGRYPENMNVGQIIEMIKKLRKDNKNNDADLFKAFSIASIFEKQMRTLSGGTTQKVSATLAFLFNPEVLILDEPTAGLDPLSSEILKDKIVREKEKGKLIIITSHLLSELDDLVSAIIFMQDGKIFFHKKIEDLKMETGENKISRAIANILKKRNVQNN